MNGRTLLSQPYVVKPELTPANSSARRKYHRDDSRLLVNHSDKDLEFLLLGPLQVWRGSTAVAVSGRRERVILAMLLLDVGNTVQMTRLIDAVWDEAPPKTARTQVHICVANLRQRLYSANATQPIQTRPSGYALDVPPAAVDVVRFRQMVSHGRLLAQVHRFEEAATAYRKALALWRGESAAADTESMPVQAAAVRFNEERITSITECIDLELRLGRHRQLLGELQQLAVEYPLREAIHGQLMVALYRDGRQAEALDVYRRAHRTLVDEHGVDPGEELRRLAHAVLENDPMLGAFEDQPAVLTTGRYGLADVALPLVRPNVVPRQLPLATDVVGRLGVANDIIVRLRVDGRSPSAEMPLSVIVGPPGVGKSALALWVAFRLRDHYPDGQLYVDLHGASADPVDPADALRNLLHAIGVPDTEIPDRIDERASLYRSTLSERRVLVVLDDAADVEHVASLLPNGPSCAVLITSRSASLALYDAQYHRLGTLDQTSGLTMLAGVVGEQRIAQEPVAAARLTTLCGHLPLALRVVAAKLSVRRHWRLDHMVERLSDERRRLDELEINGMAGVRSSIAQSMRMIAPDSRTLLFLLADLGAVNFASWVAGPLVGEHIDLGVAAFEELLDASLVEIQEEAGDRTRYRLHDLIRVFALERLNAEYSEQHVVQARTRLLTAWRAITRVAAERLHQASEAARVCAARELSEAAWADRLIGDEPRAWLRSERANLVRAIALATHMRLDSLCLDLAEAVLLLCDAQADRDLSGVVLDNALASIERSGNHIALLPNLGFLDKNHDHESRGRLRVATRHRPEPAVTTNSHPRVITSCGEATSTSAQIRRPA